MGRFWRGLSWVAALSLVVAIFLRVLVLDGFVVADDPKTSAAVAPSLAGGDTVLYMFRNAPAFGDLVRCKDPDDASRYVIGRVVGMMGDTVETNGRELSVNGKRYIGEIACAEGKVSIPHPSTGSPVDLWCDQVQIAGHPHFRGASDKAGIFTPTKTIVGQDMLFLLSDDRSYHDDSRDFGTLRADSCSGRIVFRLWSKDGWGDSRRRMTFVQ